MLAHCVKELILALQACADLPDFDIDFLISIKATFLTIPDEETLSDEYKDVLYHIFRKRWQLIADSPNDYTFDPAGINLHWISLAHKLATEDKSYLKILIPDITNTIDPILHTRLTSCEELRGFYLGDDGKTLHRVRGLFEQIQERKIFLTIDNPKNYIPRSLTLVELLRVRSKVGFLEFDLSDTLYKNFWDYLKRAVMPGWQRDGEYPKQLLSSLLELIDEYIGINNAHEIREFKQRLISWAKYLKDCSIQDVNCLYGQEISLEGKQVYLVDILLDCLQDNGPLLPSRMQALARWLCSVDASLIAKRSELKQVYAELGVGASFDILQLRPFLDDSMEESSPRIRSQLQALKNQLESSSTIESDILVSLHEIYKLRWVEIKGNELDYTRRSKDINKPWILLAEQLAGAGYIDKNYYRFLMPTLTHDTDPVKRECLTEFPLSHYILSEDAKELILLDNSAARFRSARTFLNCNSIPPKPFTQIELTRIAYAHKRFQRYIDPSRDGNVGKDPSIYLSTILAIRDLIEGSLYPNGLLFAHDYNRTQMGHAERAYQIFYKFLHELPEDEKQRLNAQQIFFQGKKTSFSSVIHLIEEGECIAVYGQYFAQLVMDYAPHIRFRAEIESRVAIDEMRGNSRKKVCRDYEQIDPKEALKRFTILLVSLITHSFQYLPLYGENISLSGRSNTVPREAKDIFLQISMMIQFEQYENAPYLYATMIETIVKPALSEQSWKTKIIRYPGTHYWLQSIADESLFKKRNSLYEPECWFAALLPIVKKSPLLHSEIELFIDQVLSVYLHPRDKSEFENQLNLNIKFFELINSMNESLKAVVLSSLETSKNATSLSNCIQQMADFVSHRFAASLAANSDIKVGFFSNKTGLDKKLYLEIRKHLMVEPKDDQTAQEIVKLLQDKLINFVSHSVDKASLSKVANYFESKTFKRLINNLDVSPVATAPSHDTVLSSSRIDSNGLNFSPI